MTSGSVERDLTTPLLNRAAHPASDRILFGAPIGNTQCTLVIDTNRAKYIQATLCRDVLTRSQWRPPGELETFARSPGRVGSGAPSELGRGTQLGLRAPKVAISFTEGPEANDDDDAGAAPACYDKARISPETTAHHQPTR